MAVLSMGEPTAPTVAVVWEAPQSCPASPELLRWIETLSGATLGSPSEAALVAHVTITAQGQGFAAALELRRGSHLETRELAAEDCAVLRRTVAVVVAVALDPIGLSRSSGDPMSDPSEGGPPEATAVPPAPDAGRPHGESGVAGTAAAAIAAVSPEPPSIVPPPSEGSPPPAVGSTSPVAVPDTEPAARPAGAPPRRASFPLETGARIGAGVGGLTLPGVGAGVAVAPFVGIRPIHGRLAVAYWFPRSASLPGRADAGARLQLWTVGARVCPRASLKKRWHFPFCTGPDFGAIHGRGEGTALTDSNAAASFWASWTFEVGFEVELLRFMSLWAAFEGVIAINRPSFSLDPGGLLHQVAPFGPRGFLGLAFHRAFPRSQSSRSARSP